MEMLDQQALKRLARQGSIANLCFLPVVATLLILATACSSSKPAAAIKSQQEYSKAPEFSLKDAHGQTVRLSDFKGKIVVLDFWATWCGPCKIEIPWFIEFQRKYADRGFSVVGISLDEDGWQAVLPFLKEKDVNYPVLIGNGELAAKYGNVEVLPTTFIIDREGRIVATHQGLTSKGGFEDAIKSLL